MSRHGKCGEGVICVGDDVSNALGIICLFAIVGVVSTLGVVTLGIYKLIVRFL